jgi:5-methylcytosine-specific restriction endonuclease McrA
MDGKSWKQDVQLWTLKRRSLSKAFSKIFIQFFEKAFEETSRPEKVWFGVHNSTISLVVGGIFLASVNSSGDIWLLIDKYLEAIEGIDYRTVRSTKKAREPLVWLHAQEFNVLKQIIVKPQIWQSYALASEKIFNSPISVSRDEIWQRNRKKTNLSEFWKKNAKEEITFPDEILSSEIYFEGSVREVTVNVYERDRNARKKCIQVYGTKCVVCDFDFETKYGKLLKGYIHVHHLKPLSEIDREYEVNPITDLRPVCPNCHVVIHKRNPPFSIEEVKAMLQNK